MPLITL